MVTHIFCCISIHERRCPSPIVLHAQGSPTLRSMTLPLRLQICDHWCRRDGGSVLRKHDEVSVCGAWDSRLRLRLEDVLLAPSAAAEHLEEGEQSHEMQGHEARHCAQIIGGRQQ